MNDFRLPADDERITIIGSTGSGKTTAGLWQLSMRDWKRKPWVILDFKGDRLVNDIPGAKYLKLGDKIPKKPGIYIAQPLPDQVEEVETLLWKIWNAGKTGLFVDEGYMLDKSKAYRALLTQGRSKRIPIVTLVQRPVWVDRFAISEANHLHLFDLHDIRDRMTVQPLLKGIDYVRDELEPYHSYWWDVGRKAAFTLRPVPEWDKIRPTFEPPRSERRFL